MRCEPTESEGVLLSKGAGSRTPPSRLQHVVVSEEPLSAAGAPQRPQRVMRRNGSGGGGAAAGTLDAAPSSAFPAPVVVRGGGRSVEEREAEYERARERILGLSSGDSPHAASGDGEAQAPPAEESEAPLVPPPCYTHAASPPPSSPPPPLPPPQPPQPPSPAQSSQAATGGGATPARMQRATRRNRDADRDDPDFHRPAYGYTHAAMPYAGGYMPGAYDGYVAGYDAAPYGAGYAQQWPMAAAAGPVVGGVRWSGAALQAAAWQPQQGPPEEERGQWLG